MIETFAVHLVKKKRDVRGYRSQTLEPQGRIEVGGRLITKTIRKF